jgi:adenosine deaminase
MFGGWLSDVFAAARDVWALTDDDLASIAQAAVDVSFAGETIKADLTGGIASWLATDATAAEPATA